MWNGCTIDTLPQLSRAWWFTPTRAPYRYYNAIGANGNILLDGGVRGSGRYDGCGGDTCRNPRSAVCIEADGAVNAGNTWMPALAAGPDGGGWSATRPERGPSTSC